MICGVFMKLIIVVGGVISGVGKGIITSSIGRILKEYGYDVTAIKIDPYINYDAGTLRPTEHGEVWVTDDGGEIDQDLGNYERFLGIDIPKKNNITTGQIYKDIIDRERKGEYLGQTVQFIPHVPNEIKRRIKEAAEGHDFALIEIGGTVGDYENMPFLFATKSLEVELGKENVSHVLVTYMPVPDNVGEMKTKPTQQAIRMLNETGIFPDFVVCRSKIPIDSVRKNKIEVYANIDSERIISAPDVKTVYRVPLMLEKENFGAKILNKFYLKPKRNPDWKNWIDLVNKIENPSRIVKIGIVGKYVDIGDYKLVDSYISINHALEHASAQLDVGLQIDWIDSKMFEKDENALENLKQYKGILVPGGFGSSGVEGKILAIRYARENNIPFLGLCYGLQLAVVEFARSIGLQAHTTEVDQKTQHPVIDILETQKDILKENRYGASMRLGAYTAILKKDSLVLDLYTKTGRLQNDGNLLEKIISRKELHRLGQLTGDNIAIERHRHRYEVNPVYVETLENKGLVFSGFHKKDDGTKLMEFIEMPNHKFFVATQAHPEFKSRIGDPSPLFLGFVEACMGN